MDIRYFYNPTKQELDKLLIHDTVGKSEVTAIVNEILEAVKQDGDEAIKYYSKKIDKVELSSIVVDENEFSEAEEIVSEKMKKSLIIAKNNIEAFHSIQKAPGEKIEVMKGVDLSRKIVPLSSVGLYIPGGTAPLFSTVLMLAVPAKVAGCKNIVLSTPPMKNGKVNPIVLYAAKLCGVTKVIKAGGASAIAALAYGTKSVNKVDKIFGPGNQFVSTAKMIVSSTVAIDMLAGPSEVMVISEPSSNPDFVASDFLSQAEHGKDSQSMLVIIADKQNGELYYEKVLNSIDKQLKMLDRKEYLLPSLDHSFIFIVDSKEKALEIVNLYAPEHLVVNIEECDDFAENVINAGSIFLGPYSCESAGDYASGTNHTLPTNGWAHSQSGVSLDSFIKKITIQKISREGLNNLSDTIITMAEGESLSAHANAVKVRLGEN